MLINLSYGASVSTTARTVINSVAQFFQAQFSDPITINISVTFGPIGGLGQSSASTNTYTYSQIKTALANDATSSDDVSAVSFLPATDPITGTHSWTMTLAEAKALGLIAGNGTASDGSMTFSNTAAFDYDRSTGGGTGISTGTYDFYGVVAHEMTEVMGRQLNAVGNNVATGAGFHPLDLFKYASATNHSFTGTQSGYFSVNNGFSDLNPIFNTNPNGDFGDWANSEAGDSFRAFSDSGVVNAVTTADLVVMDAIGFTRTDDYISTTATTGQVTVGSSTTGNVNYLRDHDWIRVQLTAGLQYTIDEQGQSVGAGTLSDPFLALYNAASQLITSDDNSGGNSNSRIVYAPTATGAYYIDAGAYVDAGTGTYRVSVSSAPVAAGSVAIGDMTIAEGDSGTKLMTFTVTRSGGTAAFAVNFATADGTATTADHDYNANSNTLNFGTGVNIQTISITINGDTKFEPNETFFINLSGATNGATISDGQGIGTIQTDDLNRAARDFNADATSDVFWRNNSTGHVGTWEMHNNVPTWHDLGGSGVDHKVAGIGDFNGDGTADLFWRNDATGHVGTWEMHNNVPTWHDLGGSGVDHKVVGIGDFNGDRTADVLWRNDSSGHVGIWEMHDNVQTWHDLGGSGTDHKVVGIGDFNNDGTADMLWRNDSSGHVGIWEMHNSVQTWHDLGGSGTDHKVVGIGDFNGDHTMDVLWRNDSTGHVGIWEMHNNVQTWHDLGGSGTDFKVAGIGDYNGDGTSDIFWRNNSDGHVGIWEMHNDVPTWHDLGLNSGVDHSFIV